jgi:hypothetical protein
MGTYPECEFTDLEAAFPFAEIGLPPPRKKSIKNASVTGKRNARFQQYITHRNGTYENETKRKTLVR